MTSSLVVIPARYASSRLPAKPLLAETGKPLIQYSYEAAKASTADRVIVATDDHRIVEAVESFGGEVVMTDPAHQSGTARVAEVIENIDADIVINMQGDEPEVSPHTIDILIELHKQAIRHKRQFFTSTLICPFQTHAKTGIGSPEDPACVKAVISNPEEGIRRALYFSRAMIPFLRDVTDKPRLEIPYYMHLGLYAFTPAALKQYVHMPPSILEEVEKLEQLRILEAGFDIATAIVPMAAPGIDTPEDYSAFVKRQAGIS